MLHILFKAIGIFDCTFDKNQRHIQNRHTFDLIFDTLQRCFKVVIHLTSPLTPFKGICKAVTHLIHL